MKPIPKNKRKMVHILLEGLVIIKAIDGIFEIIQAGTIAFLSDTRRAGILRYFFHEEMEEDPQDSLINHFLQLSDNLAVNTKIFLIVYLVVHGLIKIAIAIAIFTNSPRAYLASTYTLIAFISYQLYRLTTYSHSKILLAFTIFDVLIVLLMIYDYRLRFKSPKKP